MEHAKEIQNIIEKVLVEKTFSLEIIEQIKKLRDDVVSLESANERMKKELIKNELLATNEKALKDLAVDLFKMVDIWKHPMKTDQKSKQKNKKFKNNK